MDTADLRVRLETGSEAVCALLRRLPPEMRGSSFQHPTWVDCWSDVAGRARPTIAVVVECPVTERPFFVLPLVRQAIGPARCWVPLDRGVTDYNASLVARDFQPSQSEFRALWKRISAVLAASADLMLIDKIPVEIGGRREPLAAVAGLRPSRVVRHPLKLDADYATLRNTRFCPTMVRSLDRKRRKLQRKGRFAFHIATGRETLPILDRLMSWRDARYGEQPETTALYRRLLAADGPARVMWLSLDGEPISAGFGVIEPQAFRLLAIGHAEKFKNWSPGLLIVEDAIAWAVGQGLGEFDFTIGTEAYKLDFGVTPEPLWTVAQAYDLVGLVTLGLIFARKFAAARLKRYLAFGRPRRRNVETAEETSASPPAATAEPA